MYTRVGLLFRLGIAAIIVSGLLVGPPAVPQCTDDTSPPVVVTEGNTYLGLAIGQGGKWGFPRPNHFLQGDQPAGGRFQIWTTGGDPTTLMDDNQTLNYSIMSPPMPGDLWGAFELMVDGITTASGEEQSVRAWCTFERGVTQAMLGDLLDGTWEIWPYTPTNKTKVITGVWYPNIEKGVSPTLAEVDIVPFRLRCELEARIMRDTVRFKWTMTNEDFQAHTVGLRMFADVTPNPIDDGTVDMKNIVYVPGRPLVTDRSVLTGKDVPAMLEMFNSQTDPVMSVRFIYKGQGATTPDMVGVDEWPILAGSVWTYWYGMPTGGGDPYAVFMYEPVPNHIIYDLGYGAFWKPRRVVPGGSITFITYMGLGCATSDFTKPNLDVPQYVASVQGPRTLKYTNETQDGVGQLYPLPFNVYAYMTNLEKSTDFENASFTLTLPSGLALDDSEGGKYTKSLTRINADTEAKVTWKVKPVNYPTGILNYSVSFSAAPVGGTSVRREINVPATEFQPLPIGWQMISVPFELSDPDPTVALRLTNATFWRYDPYSRKYLAVTRLIPGEAYWLKLNTAQMTSMTPGNYSPKLWAGTQGYQIPLQTGWNLVGNPYLYTVTLGEVKFYYRDYGAIDYDEAVTRGLITSTVFWWDPMFRQYKWSSDRAVQFKPWQGYWVRALRSGVTMIVSPASQIGAAVGGQPTSDEGGGTDGGGPPSGP
jgi:hypothetical protein